MKKLVATLEGLPWIVQLILVLLWGVYANLLRLFRSIAAGNVLAIVLSIVLLCWNCCVSYLDSRYYFCDFRQENLVVCLRYLKIEFIYLFFI